jgi:transcriptional regulator with GAF, ATPase, and Fis domain
LRRALAQHAWNQTKTARQLELPLRTLVHKIKMLGIKRPPSDDAAD